VEAVEADDTRLRSEGIDDERDDEKTIAQVLKHKGTNEN